MLIVFLSIFVAFLALMAALYAVYTFIGAIYFKNQQTVETLHKENEKLRFDKKRMQLIINQLESERIAEYADE